MRKKKIDASKYETQEYWNKLLADFGLSVERGRHPKTVYVGDSQQLILIDALEGSKGTRGAKKPSSD